GYNPAVLPCVRMFFGVRGGAGAGHRRSLRKRCLRRAREAGAHRGASLRNDPSTCSRACSLRDFDRRAIMKIHEYQAKELLRKYGVVTPRGKACFSVDEAVAAAEELGGKIWVVKAQIHAGGRGKGGGVKLARSMDEVRQLAGEILGMQLVTHQ